LSIYKLDTLYKIKIIAQMRNKFKIWKIYIYKRYNIFHTLYPWRISY